MFHHVYFSTLYHKRWLPYRENFETEPYKVMGTASNAHFFSPKREEKKKTRAA